MSTEPSFEHAEYGVFEGGEVTLAVVLSADPERTVTVPLTRTNQGGATGSDYSGVPASVTFASGETRKTFVFEALEDTDEEDGESVKLGFGTRPDRVDPGANDETTVTIRDCEGGGIWCGTVDFGVHVERADGRKKLIRTYGNGSGTLDHDQFLYNGITYEVSKVALWPAPAVAYNPGPPFSIPERGQFTFSLHNLNATDPGDRYSMPNEDYLDWTLYIKTGATGGGTLEAALPFNEAKFCCGRHWRWYGLDLEELNAAWSEGKLYKLRIVEDPRADRVGEALGPPLYLEVTGLTRRSVGIRWVRPQIRNDGAPPGVSYRIEWKESADSWDTEADVSEHVYDPGPGNEWLFYTIRGLTPGVEYHVRVIAVNDAGDSPPSNVASRRTEPDPADRGQQAEAAPNNPATGSPGISGTLAVGETLTATTSGISDDDGLSNAVFAYQWIRHGPADQTGAEIPGETARTYTVTSDDDGKGLRVRVAFTDDAGNRESLTSNAYLTAPPVQDPSGASDDPAANSPATGAPTIDGTARVGRTLTAETSDIGDPDGMDDAAFAYRWAAGGNDIAGATAASHTLTADEERLAITVRVSFTDDAGNPETLTSAATPAVTAPALQFESASVNGATLLLTYDESLDEGVSIPTEAFTVRVEGNARPVSNVSVAGPAVALTLSPAVAAGETVTVDYNRPAGPDFIRDTRGRVADSFNGREVTNNTDTPDAPPQDNQVPGPPGKPDVSGPDRTSLSVSWTAPASGGGSAVTGYTVQWKETSGSWDTEADVSQATATGTTRAITGLTEGTEYTVRVIAANDAGDGPPSPEATGTPRESIPPELSTVSVAGAAVTLTFDEALDETSVPGPAAFTVIVGGEGRPVDAVAVSGSVVTVTLVTAVASGDAVSLGYTAPTGGSGGPLQDMAGNIAASFSGKAVTNGTRPADPLTASLSGIPESHDGHFTFELHFSEEFSISYVTLRDQAFTVTGGSVTKARRLAQPSNIGWEIHVTPDSGGTVTIMLPVTTDCTADGAVCTGDRRPLSNRLEVIVPGPGG